MGGTLAHERELVRHYGVSRAVMREALRILESDGFVIVKPGRNGGGLVCRPAPERFTSNLAAVLQIRKVRLKSLLEVRMVLEPFSARLAAVHLASEHRRQLKELAGTLAERAKNARLFDEDNAALHGLIGAASGNALLDIFTASLRDLIYQSTASIELAEDVRRKNTEGHLKIIDAIVARDFEEAERRMSRHIEAFARFVANRVPALMDSMVEPRLERERVESPPILHGSRPESTR